MTDEPKATAMCLECGGIRMVSPRWTGRPLKCTGCGRTTRHDLVPMRGTVDWREHRNEEDQQKTAANLQDAAAMLNMLDGIGVHIRWTDQPVTGGGGANTYGAAVVRYADRPGVPWGIDIYRNLTADQLLDTLGYIFGAVCFPSKWSPKYTSSTGHPSYWLCLCKLPADEILAPIPDEEARHA